MTERSWARTPSEKNIFYAPLIPLDQNHWSKNWVETTWQFIPNHRNRDQSPTNKEPVNKLLASLRAHFLKVKSDENDRIFWPTFAFDDQPRQLQQRRDAGAVVVVAVGRVNRVPVGTDDHLIQFKFKLKIKVF